MSMSKKKAMSAMCDAAFDLCVLAELHSDYRLDALEYLPEVMRGDTTPREAIIELMALELDD